MGTELQANNYKGIRTVTFKQENRREKDNEDAILSECW
jgi:hypothetical protein